MRTKALLLTAAVFAAGIASSLAQVYSLNVVGYANVVLTGGGKYTGVANPLDTTNNTLGGLFSGLPNGAQVLKWNTSISDYDSFTKVPFGTGWSPASGSTTTLAPGEGTLVFVSGVDVTNTFVGEVKQGSLTNNFITGFQLVGNIVPDAGAVTSLQLTNVPNTSQILKWNVSIQDFDTFTKVPFGSGWSPSPPTLNVGDSFFMSASSPFSWVRNFTVQ